MRSLFKKAIELSQMCDLDICIIVRDRLLDKVSQFTSSMSSESNEYFSIEKAHERIMKDLQIGKNIRTYTDKDYENLKVVAKAAAKAVEKPD